jgi:hypothetical protein
VAADSIARDLGGLTLADALELVGLIGRQRPHKLKPAALRWHGRLELRLGKWGASRSGSATSSSRARARSLGGECVHVMGLEFRRSALRQPVLQGSRAQRLVTRARGGWGECVLREDAAFV